MALTDAKVRAAKPLGKIKKLSDGRGLQLCVMPTGGKLWRLAYRFNRKERSLSIGAYPAVGIADARRVAEAGRAALAKGIDPSAEKKATKAVQPANAAPTFGDIAAEFLDKKRKEGRAVGTMDKLVWQLSLAKPFLASLPVAGITTKEVYAALESVQAKGNRETARKMRSTIGGVFRFAISTGRAANDPTLALKDALIAPTVRHRPAITDPKALGGLLRAVDGFQGQPTTRACMQLLALLFTRPGELRLAEWREFDLDKAIFEIPASRMKGRKPHAVPLPRQAIAILRALYPVTGRFALVFPGLRSTARPISENTLNGCLRRLGISQDEMTPHGWRSTASTLLNESGKWSPDAIERALAHAGTDKIRSIYARGSYWAERVRMAQGWADYLDELRVGGE